MVRLTDRLDMTIVVEWDVKPQIKQNKNLNDSEFSRSIGAKSRGDTPRKFAEFLSGFSRSFSAKSRGEKKMVCANLREISRICLRESSHLRIFVRGMNAKKELFSWADLYVPVLQPQLHYRVVRFSPESFRP